MSEEELWNQSPLLHESFFEKNEPRATLVGYAGGTPYEGKRRLYLDIEFNTYVDIESKDVLHTIPVGSDVIEGGGIRVWISKYAEVIYGGTFAQKITAKSLQEELRKHEPSMLIPGLMGIYGPESEETEEGGFGLGGGRPDRH